MSWHERLKFGHILSLLVFATLLYVLFDIETENVELFVPRIKLRPGVRFAADWAMERILKQSKDSTESSNDIKLIVDWTTFFGAQLSQIWASNKWACPDISARCEFTNDRKRVLDADVVVFHMRDLKWDKIPKQRRQEQRYVFFLMESPFHAGPVQPLTDKMRHFFNWTMTYRNDSDVVIPYVKLIPRQNLNDTTWREKLEEAVATKHKSAMWLVSNCKTHSKRENYVKELSKHIRVDTFGRCGKNGCPRGRKEDECLTNEGKKYWFLIAFENSICRDYITEKFSRVRYLMLPLVLKRSIYTGLVPNNSYIAVDDYANIGDLAEHMKYLMNDTNAYMSYFDWMQDYELTVDTWPYTLCDLCRKVLTDNTTQIRDHIWEWYHDNVCEDNFADNLLKKQLA